MARVRQRGTTPELNVRRIAASLGILLQTNVDTLPGSPDLVSKVRRYAVFVHGCFWHRHAHCRAATTPTANQQFWLRKFDANVRRDRRKARALRALGYRVFTVWECQVKSRSGTECVARRMQSFFERI